MATPRGDSIRLGPWHQWAVYGSTVVLVASGLVWLVLHYFLAQPGEFGDTFHPGEPWMLRLHGAGAMVGLIVYGSLLPVHIRRAWTIRRNIGLGISLGSLLIALTVSGYLLYYAGDEETRPVISVVHWVVGLAIPGILTWHVISGRRRKTRD